MAASQGNVIGQDTRPGYNSQLAETMTIVIAKGRATVPKNQFQISSVSIRLWVPMTIGTTFRAFTTSHYAAGTTAPKCGVSHTMAGR